jgi:hypothetical protein
LCNFCEDFFDWRDSWRHQMLVGSDDQYKADSLQSGDHAHRGICALQVVNVDKEDGTEDPEMAFTKFE